MVRFKMRYMLIRVTSTHPKDDLLGQRVLSTLRGLLSALPLAEHAAAENTLRVISCVPRQGCVIIGVAHSAVDGVRGLCSSVRIVDGLSGQLDVLHTSGSIKQTTRWILANKRSVL